MAPNIKSNSMVQKWHMNLFSTISPIPHMKIMLGSQKLLDLPRGEAIRNADPSLYQLH